VRSCVQFAGPDSWVKAAGDYVYAVRRGGGASGYCGRTNKGISGNCVILWVTYIFVCSFLNFFQNFSDISLKSVRFHQKNSIYIVAMF
jgi:hypothetical protein